MIYTVTLNPAVDYVVHVPALIQGQILRSTREQVFFGGKGVNVSSVLHTLGVASVATGFLAGFTGQAIEAELARQGIGTDFVFLPDGFTRINLKLRTGVETDINGGGPVIGPADLAALEEKLTRLQAGDIAVLAGSVPLSLAGDPYADLMAHLAGRGLRFVVDTTGAQLRSVLPLQPFLVKPNGQELGELFGVRIASAAEAAEYDYPAAGAGGPERFGLPGRAGGGIGGRDRAHLAAARLPGRDGEHRWRRGLHGGGLPGRLCADWQLPRSAPLGHSLRQCDGLL